jgi:hypothetical protein
VLPITETGFQVEAKATLSRLRKDEEVSMAARKPTVKVTATGSGIA